MKLQTFKEIVSLFEKCIQVRSDATKFVKAKTFEPFTDLHLYLLTEIYQEEAVKFIFLEWLGGNKNPLKVELDRDTSVIYPLETVEDLHKAMELYKIEK